MCRACRLGVHIFALAVACAEDGGGAGPGRPAGRAEDLAEGGDGSWGHRRIKLKWLGVGGWAFGGGGLGSFGAWLGPEAPSFGWYQLRAKKLGSA